MNLDFVLTDKHLENIGIVTHYDLDGIACYEAISSFLGREDIKCNYSFRPDSDESYNLALELLKKHPSITTLFVTDREINDFHIRKILEDYPNLMIIHIDHHRNSKHLTTNNVMGYYGTNPNDYSKSACELSLDFCLLLLNDFRKINQKDFYNLEHLMTLVGDWDTFRWKTLDDKDRVNTVKGLMAIEKLYGSETLFKTIREMSGDNSINIETEEFTKYLHDSFKLYKDNLQKEYSKVANKVLFRSGNTKIAIVPNVDSLYLSLIANKYLENNEESIFITFYPSGLVSSRGSTVKNKVNLQELMFKLPGGGGGHFNAAGGKLFKDILENKEEFDSVEQETEYCSIIIDFLSTYL